MDEQKKPFLVVGVKGQQYVYETEESLEYSEYRKIKAIAESTTHYAANARCVNPDVLAYQFTTRVKEELGVILIPVPVWPQIAVKFKK